jgi:zinc transport system permease protein
MAYFGDTLAHSALLGVAIGMLAGLDLNVAVVLLCALVAVTLVILQQQRRLASDTLLGIVSHAALSLGMVAVAFMERVRIDLIGFLFGDILSVDRAQLLWVYLGGLLTLAAVSVIWRRLLAMTVHEDLAAVEGVPVLAIRLIFMLLIAVVIAISMQIVGILLITSLLIIPAATARRFAGSPEQMAVIAACLGCVAVIAGLFGSLQWDVPSGPAIVVAAALLFGVSLAAPFRRA